MIIIYSTNFQWFLNSCLVPNSWTMLKNSHCCPSHTRIQQKFNFTIEFAPIFMWKKRKKRPTLIFINFCVLSFFWKMFKGIRIIFLLLATAYLLTDQHGRMGWGRILTPENQLIKNWKSTRKLKINSKMSTYLLC